MKTQRSETLPLKVLAVLISILIWGWIQLNEEESDVKIVTISYLTPENLIQSEELPKSISVFAPRVETITSSTTERGHR